MPRLLLLGSPTLFDDTDAPVPLWRTHTALLAYLALARGYRASREVAARVLWPDADDQGARLSLRQALFRLRKEVGEVVGGDAEVLELSTDRLAIDLIDFERDLADGRYEAAAERYRGDLLTDFLLPNNPEFDQWVDGERARLRTGAAEAFRHAVDRASARGEWNRAAQWAERWYQLFPMSDAAAERLIALYAQTGDRHRAMVTYQAFSRRLREELNVVPGQRVEGLVERIRRVSRPLGRISLVATSERPNPESPFVGRANEFERLLGRWTEARQGRRQIAVVTGAPGIGKSRLAREFAQRIRLSGGTVLAGRAFQMERVVPYAALADLLGGARDAPGVTAVDPAQLAEIIRVVPRLGERFPGLRPNGAGGAASAPTPALLEATHALVASLIEEAPVLLVLEDAPFADEPTLAALSYAIRHLPQGQLMVLLTSTEESFRGGPVGDLVRPFAREDPERVEHIPLGPLSVRDVQDLALLLHESNHDPELAELLHSSSGGHPARLVELLRSRG